MQDLAKQRLKKGVAWILSSVALIVFCMLFLPLWMITFKLGGTVFLIHVLSPLIWATFIIGLVEILRARRKS